DSAGACDIATATVQIQGADLSPQLSGLPSVVAPGASVSGTLTCSNAGPGLATQVGCSVTGGSVGACTVASQAVTLPLASLPAGAAVICPISATAPASGKLDLVATSSAGNDNVPGNDRTSASVAVIDAVDDGPVALPAAGGSVALYGNDTLGGVVITPGQVKAELLDAGGLTGATLDAATGRLIVPAGNLAGTYRARYQICAEPAVLPAACDSAVATVLIGGAPDLVVTKSHLPALFTEANPGRYSIVATNQGDQPTSGAYTVLDTLPDGMTVGALPVGSGWDCTATVIGSRTARCTGSGVIKVGESAAPIALQVQVASGACRTPDANHACSGAAALVNSVAISGGGESSGGSGNNRYDDPTPVQQAGAISGQVWIDSNHDRLLSPGEVPKAGLIVEVLDAGGTVVGRGVTDAQGAYRIDGLIPGGGYGVRFRDPANGTYYGRPVSNDPAGGNDPSAAPTTGLVASGQIAGITVPSGSRPRINQSLPLDPNGVVYAADSRLPLAGAQIELLDAAGNLVPAGCMLGGINRITTTVGAGGVDGAYNFLLLSPVPAGCPGVADYQIGITPASGYVVSKTLPAEAGTLQPPAGCLNGSGTLCLVQAQSAAPTGSQPTTYYLRMHLDPLGGPEVVNNHLPLDAAIGPALLVSKTGDHSSAEVGDSVRYTVTIRRTDSGKAYLPALDLIDTLPTGFRYINGTAQIGTTSIADPVGAPGPQLRFHLNGLTIGTSVTLSYRVRVGVGAQQGDGVNRAQASSVVGGVCGASAGATCSNEASFRVRVSGGVFGTDACVVGKVYVDCDHDHMQGAEEPGIPGVRLYLQDGSSIITDVEGKFSRCSLPPRTHVLVVDQTTLPRGSRLTTSSSRNAGDANSLFLDLTNGELQRADFIEGSCSNTVLEQVKARRNRGDSGSLDTEKQGGAVLKFDGKPVGAPGQATDSANQRGNAAGQGEPGAVKPRLDGGKPAPAGASTQTGQTINSPVPATSTSSGATQPGAQP
ncbi:MAG: SdrD B-like domain-containing protein, partial [Leptothrix sp. (in: b-proteobacteria)]